MSCLLEDLRGLLISCRWAGTTTLMWMTAARLQGCRHACGAVRCPQDYTTRRLEKKLPPIAFRLVSVSKVENPFLAARFAACRQRMKEAGRTGASRCGQLCCRVAVALFDSLLPLYRRRDAHSDCLPRDAASEYQTVPLVAHFVTL